MLTLRYKNEIMLAEWTKRGTIASYQLRCPRCWVMSLLTAPFKFTVDTELLTVVGVFECPAPRCSWRGTIIKGVIEDVR